MSEKKSRKPNSPKQVREPVVEYARSTAVPTFFGQPMLRGICAQVTPTDRGPQLFYSHPHGELWLGDTVMWLRSVKDESVDAI